MAKMVFIVSGGRLGEPDFLRERIAAAGKPLLICADRGAAYCYRLGIVPEIIIGDMDSLPKGMQEFFASQGSELSRFPAEKKETDTELALQRAFLMKPGEVWVFGALGNRIDHSLANISLLARGEEAGIPVRLVDEWCEVFLVSGSCMIEGKPGETVSLFPYAERASGINLTGFEYGLSDGVFELGRPYGISNRLIESEGTVSVASGRILVVRYFTAGKFPGGD
ncbi:MAG: thiamine diphosphokinase [Smithellaceae bacterium]|nr:thiamine diphosphokinase [Smithellaceae bacterium]